MISRFLVRLVLNLRQGRFVIEIHIISADKRVEKLSVYGQACRFVAQALRHGAQQRLIQPGVSSLFPYLFPAAFVRFRFGKA